MVTLDLKSGILPACLITALAAIAYVLVVSVGVLTVTIKPDRKPAVRAGRQGTGSALARLMHHDRADLPRRAPRFEHAVRVSMPTVFVLLIVATGPASSVTAGDYFGRSEAGSATWFNVINDPRLCPPATPRTGASRQSCVIVASDNGKAVTRWIDDTTGQLSPASLTWTAPTSGYISTTTWFPVVRPLAPNAR